MVITVDPHRSTSEGWISTRVCLLLDGIEKTLIQSVACVEVHKTKDFTYLTDAKIKVKRSKAADIPQVYITKLKVSGYYPTNTSVQSSRETSKADTIPMHVTYDNLQKHRNKEFIEGPFRRYPHPTKPLDKPYENSNRDTKGPSHFPPYNINISNHIIHHIPP